MIEILRTNSENQDFMQLVKHLDDELAVIDGSEHSFYAQYNKVNQIRYVVVAYELKKPIACGAIKEFAPDVMEVKRMYTSPEVRGKGIASKVITDLEVWATELTYKKCILETGVRQPDAIRLYEKNGYKVIPNYGQYAGIENSVCFGKELT